MKENVEVVSLAPHLHISERICEQTVKVHVPHEQFVARFVYPSNVGDNVRLLEHACLFRCQSGFFTHVSLCERHLSVEGGAAPQTLALRVLL